MSKKIPLVEMFGPTIQGEGAVIGQQTYFMRFGLCDYKCTMCDSMNAVDPMQVKANARFLTPDEIAHEFHQFYKPNTTRWITLSGGNPCIHDLTVLVHELKSHGHKIAVETQGTFFPGWLDRCDIITISPKGPGMGENTDLKVLDKFLDDAVIHDIIYRINFKVVIFDERDLEFVRMLWERYIEGKFSAYGIPFYLSLGNPYPPGYHEESHPIDHANHMLELVRRYRMIFKDIQNDRILSNMRLLPQWHVFVWGNEKGK